MRPNRLVISSDDGEARVFRVAIDDQANRQMRCQPWWAYQGGLVMVCLSGERSIYLKALPILPPRAAHWEGRRWRIVEQRYTRFENSYGQSMLWHWVLSMPLVAQEGAYWQEKGCMLT